MKSVKAWLTMTAIAAVTCATGEEMATGDTAARPDPWADSARVGEPVDLAPWGYAWRAGLAVQEKPEAYFIPRRLDRLDRVYRTAFQALPEPELKSIYYTMPDLLQPLLPPPRGRLLAGLLWTGGLVDYRVELHWPVGAREIPPPAALEVRAYPTSFGWFGWTVDQILGEPEIAADGRTWTYRSDPTAKMDSAYSARVEAATEMVAVFCEEGAPGVVPVVPSIRVVGPNLGVWQRLDVEIEWGFQAGTEQGDFDGWLESHVALLGPPTPLAEDKGTTVAGGRKWQSRAVGGTRRGIVVPLLYAPSSRPGLDSRVTLWNGTSGLTFRVSDLEHGPILIPGQGVFVTRVGSGQTARQFAGELAAAGPRSIRQMTREHPEAASWDELMQEVRLWTCPAGTPVPPFPQVADPPMQVQLPDPRWTAAWRAGTDQLRGRHMWGNLAFEVGRVAHEMEMVGLHAEAAAIYDYFLLSPGVKSDGDYADGRGSLEWAKSLRHDMGYSHEGTHASTGRLLFAMAERYFLTGDREWFRQHRERLQAAADWIIRERTNYMKDIPNRQELFVAGLMPPCMLGDYAIPSCDWHWYYVDNALSLQGLQRFAEALAELDPAAGLTYHTAAAAFRTDLLRAVQREAALAPVRRGRKGTFHSYMPRMAYAAGLTGPELGAPQFPECDRFIGALPLAEPFVGLAAHGALMVDTLDAMEDMGTSASAVREREEARKQKDLPTAAAWFWHAFVILPKASHNANIYLLQDDVPSFLRFWMNSYASVVGADGKLWEHWHLGGYAECTDPDNGTAGWFMENFRNLLVQEENQSLWVARATPRAWLEQGKRIAVRNAPTYFGVLAYEIVSDVANGTITATIEIPPRSPAQRLLLRLRHPQAMPITGVTVNGQPWSGFSPDREVIELKGVTGTAIVVARY